MDPDIKVHTPNDVDLSGALVVVGGPTLGLVGTIAARYIVKTLDMELVGGLHSDAFPPTALVHKGRPVHPIRIHTLATRCGMDLDCDRVVVVTSEIMLDKDLIWPVARTLAAWTDAISAELVVVPDAVVTAKGSAPSDRMRGVATTEAAHRLLANADIEPLGDGVIMGLSGALLSIAEEGQRDLACVVAESQPDHPDARAAARIVQVLDKILPDVPIEAKPLEEEAVRIERNVEQMRAQLKAVADQEGRPAVSMYH